MLGRLGMFVILLVSVSCTSESSNLLRVHPGRAEGGMGAIVQGVVEIDLEVGCVWLSTPDGARHPVVWPAGTAAREDPFEIVLRGGETVVDGDGVSGGGGYVPAETATPDLEPFPADCLQDGQAAVFNADSDIEVVPDVGVDTGPTLFDRFSVPEPIGLEMIAVNPNRRSVAVADFVSGTVHLYGPSHYEGPSDAIDGASGGGGFIHLWSQGTVYSYPGTLDAVPLVYQPEPLRQVDGVAPTLEVLPAPDGEHTWLVQDGAGFGPTLVELVDLVGVQVARIVSIEVDGSWQPHGTTTAGLVLASNEGDARTLLVGINGSIEDPVPGEPLSVGWGGAVILEDRDLRVTGPDLSDPIEVDRPVPGEWASVGGPVIPSDAPPIRTGAAAHLVGIVESVDPGSPGNLVVVREDGSARAIYEMERGEGTATFSRGGDWVALVGAEKVTLIPARGDPISLGEIIPPDHWVLTAG